MKGRTLLETQSSLLDLIRSHGSVTRVDLAHESGLTEATISRIVKSFLERGLILEIGTAKSTGGKRATLLQLNARAHFAIGVSIDPLNVLFVLADLSGAAVKIVRTDGIGELAPAVFVARVATELQEFLRSSGVPTDRVIGVGIANPGDIDAATGRVSWSPTVAPDYFAVEEAFRAATGLPVVLENDAGCVALGEFWSSRMTADQDFATVYLATGVGSALVMNGALYRGMSGGAGILQHMIIDADGDVCWCGARGCLRTLTTPASVVEIARREPRLATLLDEVDGTAYASLRALVDAADRGDEVAARVLDDSARHLANAVLSIVNLLDLGKVVLAGPGFDAVGERYLRPITDTVAGLALARGKHSVVVEMRRGGATLAALGAAAVVLHRLLTPHHDVREVRATA